MKLPLLNLSVLLFAALLPGINATCQTDPELTALAERQKIQGFKNALTAIAKEPADPCEAPGPASSLPSREWHVFENAADAISDDLSDLAAGEDPAVRVKRFLQKLEKLSLDINQ